MEHIIEKRLFSYALGTCLIFLENLKLTLSQVYLLRGFDLIKGGQMAFWGGGGKRKTDMPIFMEYLDQRHRLLLSYMYVLVLMMSQTL